MDVHGQKKESVGVDNIALDVTDEGASAARDGKSSAHQPADSKYGPMAAHKDGINTPIGSDTEPRKQCLATADEEPKTKIDSEARQQDESFPKTADSASVEGKDGTLTKSDSGTPERKTCCQPFNWPLYNIIIVSVGFMLNFAGFFPASMILPATLESVKRESPSYSGDAFVSLAILYFAYAGFSWFTPSIISLLGYKISMFFASLTYAFFVLSNLYPAAWLLYLASVVCGCGSALFWAANGVCITENSPGGTLARNSGLFWGIYIFSTVLGNIFVSQQFAGVEVIGPDLRLTVFSVLGCVNVAGSFMMLLIKMNKSGEIGQQGQSDNSGTTPSSCCQIAAIKHRLAVPAQAFLASVKLVGTIEMLVITPACLYTGLTLTLFSGVYTATVGFTGAFGAEAKSLIGEAGISFGVGAMVTGVALSAVGERISYLGRDTFMMFVCISQYVMLYLIFLSFPDDSTFGETTYSSTYITPSRASVLICGVLLGVGDTCVNVQIYAVIGRLMSTRLAPAHGLYRFLQSLGGGIMFMYSGRIVLKWQLLIMVFFVTLGTIGYYAADGIAYRAERKMDGAEKQENDTVI